MYFRCTTHTKLNMIPANFVVLAVSFVYAIVGLDFSNVSKKIIIKPLNKLLPLH